MDDTNSLIEQSRARLKEIRERYKDDSLILQRVDKLDSLLAKKIDPFKNKFTTTESCDGAREKYKRGEYNDTTEVAVAGRITAHREMGKSQFIDVRDQSGRLQIYAQKSHLEETAPGSWDIFTHLDLGDFIGARGKLFTTKTGEISIKLDSFVILAKALRPPPAKWHGLEDTEIRYRQRYLDLMANPEVKDVFLKRSQIITEIRNFLQSRGYVEVETPMMQAIPGGAAAQPFKTHHNALGCDFYLRIALELYLKRLLVGGVDKVFEIGRNFRNEGFSRKHNPEFTMLEAYQAFGDYETMMKLVEEMICHVAQNVLKTLVVEHFDSSAMKEIEPLLLTKLTNLRDMLTGNRPRKPEVIAAYEEIAGNFEKQLISTVNDPLLSPLKKARRIVELLPKYIQALKADNESTSSKLIWSKQLAETVFRSTDLEFSFDGLKQRIEKLIEKSKTIDLTPNWKRAKYKDLIREKAGADWFEISPQQRRERAILLGAEIGKEYEDFEVTQAVFEKLIEPTINNYNPIFVTRLPKELVPLAKLSPDDPTTVEVFECCINGQEISPGYTEQNDPIEQRERLEHQAGGEQQKLDEDFLVALEHGMPPAGGIGIGIDRLCMMLLGQESIRDVILFPQLKPK
jgi:lysyl-tRNA synthetase